MVTRKLMPYNNTKFKSSFIIFCICCFFSNFVLSQEGLIIDSLKKSLLNLKNDTFRASLNNRIAINYRSTNIDSAKHYALKSYEVAKKINHVKSKIDALNILGLVARKKGDYIQAINYHTEALKLAQNSKLDGLYFHQIYNNLCLDYTEQGNYNAAIEYGYKSLHFIEKTKDTLNMALSNNNLADVFFYTKKYEKAIFHYRKSLEYAIQMNNLFGQGLLYGNLGSVFYQMEKLDSSFIYFNKSLNISIEIDDFFGVAICYMNIGSYFQKINENKKALEYFIKAEKIFKSQEMDSDLATVYFNISTSYLYLKNFDKSKLFAKKSLNLANKINSYPLKESAHLALTNVNEKLHNTAEAYLHYKEYISARDSTFNEENRNAQYKAEVEFSYIRKRDNDSLQHALYSKIQEVSLNQEKLKTKSQQKYTYTATLGCVIFLILAILIFKNYKEKQKANVLISSQKQEVELQKNIIEVHQKETIDSINYAKRIQYALLANKDLLNQNLPDHFVLFNPKDIVSGDFYWATQHNSKFYLAVCDSTGHGVPGAFMCLLNMGFLSEAIKEKSISKPNEVLNYVRQRLIDSIGNDGQQDGMDAILLCIDNSLFTKNETRTITYAAANNEPILVRDNQVIVLPKDKMPVGKGERLDSFTLQTIDCHKGDALYLYTDGYADQFGGPKGKKFKYKQLNDSLLSLHSDSSALQSEILNQTFENWKGDLEQVDDVCIVGIKF